MPSLEQKRLDLLSRTELHKLIFECCNLRTSRKDFRKRVEVTWAWTFYVIKGVKGRWILRLQTTNSSHAQTCIFIIFKTPSPAKAWKTFKPLSDISFKFIADVVQFQRDYMRWSVKRTAPCLASDHESSDISQLFSNVIGMHRSPKETTKLNHLFKNFP